LKKPYFVKAAGARGSARRRLLLTSTEAATPAAAALPTKSAPDKRTIAIRWTDRRLNTGRFTAAAF